MRSSQPGDNGYFISNSLLLCLYIFARLFIVDCVSFISDVTIRPLLFNELTVCIWNAVAFFVNTLILLMEIFVEKCFSEK